MIHIDDVICLKESATLRLFMGIHRGNKNEVENELKNNPHPQLETDDSRNALRARMDVIKEHLGMTHRNYSL